MMTIAGQGAGEDGLRSNAGGARRARSMDSGVPGDEVREQPQSRRLTFLWVELYREDVIARAGAGKGESVIARATRELRFLRLEEIAVAKVKPLAIRDPVPQGM